MTIKVGDKIVVDGTKYGGFISAGEVLTVTHVCNNGCLEARQEGDDFEWLIIRGTYTKLEDTPQEGTPTLWRDMTPEEKGALLLAKHEGERVEYWDGKWRDLHGGFYASEAYRIKPTPKVETERVTIVNADNMTIGHGTITTTNGKPDPASIKMEEL